MIVTRSIVLLCISLSVVACNRYNIQAIDAPGGPTSTLVVYRPPYASAAPVVIAIDGVDIAMLRNDTYLEMPISVGPHVISVRGFRVGLADEKEMTLQENAVLRLKVDHPASSVVKAAIPLSMHLSKLYYLEEDNSLSVEDLKRKFTRVDVKYKPKN
jgi:hypothetical protein